MEDKLLKYWLIQELLLQGYRLLFGFMQVILFTGAAIQVSTQHNTYLFNNLMFVALVLMGLGIKITRARALDVSYFQWQIALVKEMSPDKNILSEFKRWQKLPGKEKHRMMKEAGILPSASRKVFEVWLPGIFLVGWFAMCLIVWM
ncbi:MAG: hypothetical protein ACP5O2_07180 [Bacteroidales bacterium]